MSPNLLLKQRTPFPMEFPVFDSWKEIIAYYRKFLSGEVQECPTHDGPLEDESDLIKEQLLAINQLSVLTVDSQPGLSQQKEKGKIHWRGRLRHAEKIEFRQRAALLCFMKKPLLKKLKRAFAKKDYLFFSQRVKLSSESKEPKIFIPITAVSFTYHGVEQNLVESRQPTDGWSSGDMELILDGTPKESEREILKDLYQVNLLDPVWGQPTRLFDDLITSLK